MEHVIYVASDMRYIVDVILNEFMKRWLLDLRGPPGALISSKL